MGKYLFDRVCETSTSTGTGNFTLAGAVTGFRSFASAGTGTDDGTFYYLIEDVDANGAPSGNWEVGVGMLHTTTSTLERLAVLSSSNAGALVSFAAGTKRVHMTMPAYQLGGFAGCQVARSSNLTAQNFTTATAISWSTATVDTDGNFVSGTGFFAIGTPTRITLPGTDYTGNSYYQLCGQVALQNINAADWVELNIRLDGTTSVGRQTYSIQKTSPFLQVQSQIIQAGANDYFELMIQVGADTSVDLIASDTWFQLKVLQ